ncbi:MAG: AAA family ATPase [Candidatus Berkelbacteria bacterium]|nr:AAA family ATPase [Candidatus Berkelbacteria bacterium]
MIIGLTGTFAAGKDTVADYLEKSGFEHFSTGEEVAEIAREKGIETTRDNLRELANDLRDKYGPEFLSRRVMEKKAKTDRVVVTGLRQPGEIKYLKTFPNFFLISVDAPAEIRFERMKERNRPGDPKTLKDMITKEKKEMESAGKNAQRIHECIVMADYHLVNGGDLPTLYKHTDEVLEDMKSKSK